MRCSKCGFDNPGGMKFCGQCTAPLALVCPNCHFENPPGFKFCGQCTTALGPGSPNPPSSKPYITASETNGPAVLDGERKMVTALFADIKGSMELMEDLDPEEARAIVDPALKLMIDAVHRYDGYTVQSTGDGIFALFGAPVAHEDHPQRALYAALRMQDDIRRFAERLRAEKGMNLQVRVGANVGEVVVRSIQTGAGHAEYTPIGHSTSFASRLQSLANPGSIAISDGLRKLVEGYFALKALGPARIKGSSEPVNIYEVLGLGPLRTRLQRAVGRGLSKFVGRQREMDAMKHAAELARSGRGQIVAVVAEPGVGKSRLFHEFKATSQSGWLALEAFSVSHGKAAVYLPLIDLLLTYFRIMPDDDARIRREKVAGKLTMLDRNLEQETLPHLFALLGIVEGDDPLAQMGAQVRRRRTQDAVRRILLRESLNQPLMLIFEDLHWIDGETQAFLNLLAEGMANAPILLLVNYRPEYSHQWNSKTYYTQLRLDPLERESADEMLSALFGDGAELAPLKRLILDKTEGNPLFMEEIFQALLEDGSLQRNGSVKLFRPIEQLRLPPTVQGILAARIDRLPREQKELLQTLAVIGTEFPLTLVREVVQSPSEHLDRVLSALQAGEFIYEQPAAGDVEYTFKHALTHDVAYNSLLTERRRLLHEHTARAFEALYPERLDDYLPELANHFDRSGNIRKAVEYLGRTGVRAAQQAAYSEALGHLTRAVMLLGQLPDDTDRARRELDLQMALAGAAHVAIGATAPERETALVRAQGLCERLGEGTPLIDVLLGLSTLRGGRGQLTEAQELAEGAMALAQRSTDPRILGTAHAFLGSIMFFSGQLPAVREHAEKAVELFAPFPISHLGPIAMAQRAVESALGIMLAVLGYPDAAMARHRSAVATARRRSDPLSLSQALMGSATTQLLLRNTPAVATLAEELLPLTTDYGIGMNERRAIFFRGWAVAVSGSMLEGIREMRRVLAEPEGTTFFRPIMNAAFAEVCAKNDLVEEGLATVEESLGQPQRDADAELYRLRGELLLASVSPDEAQAERSFRKAIQVARGQTARFYELRASISLARLLRETNRRDEARAMLLDIYGWFTEGFDTADLKDAKALLEELK
jgi:class 3 adenylate cyclase/tetratricopeptide (TPR) repeat protein